MPYKDRHGRTCGFVDFEENENSGRFLRRYFIISPKDGSFYCYMDNPINLPDGSTPVADIKLFHISNARDATKQRPKREFCFVVTTPERNYYFGADNQEDLEEWVRSLNGASRIMVKIPDKKLSGTAVDDSQGNKSQNGSGDEKQSTISYKTEIVGGVVIRTPVENEDSSSSDEEGGQGRSRSWPRSPSPTPPVNRPNFAHPNAIMAGFCVKQGGVRKNWKRRFFVLNEEGFSYYKSESDKLPLRTIYKKDITSCKVSDIPLSTQRDNLFEVVTGARIFYVQANSPEEMHQWVTSIKALVGVQRSSCPTESSIGTKGSLMRKDDGKTGSLKDHKVRAEQIRRASSPHNSGPNRPSSASSIKQVPQQQQLDMAFSQTQMKEHTASTQEKDKEMVKGQRSEPLVTHL